MTVVTRVGLVIIGLVVVVVGLEVLVLGPTEGVDNVGGVSGLMNVRVGDSPALLPVAEDPLANDPAALVEAVPSGVPDGGNSAERDDGNKVDGVLDVGGELSVDGELSVEGEVSVDGDVSVEPMVVPVEDRPEELALDVPGVGTQSTPGLVCANDALGATTSTSAHPKLRL